MLECDQSCSCISYQKDKVKTLSLVFVKLKGKDEKVSV